MYAKQQRREKGFTKHKSHGSLGGTDQIDKVQCTLVIGDHQESALFIFNIIAAHFHVEQALGSQPAYGLRKTVDKDIWLVIPHNLTSLMIQTTASFY